MGKKPKQYYIKKEGFLYVLRQERFRNRKKEHPHDVMAYAHTKKEMKATQKLYNLY